MTAGRTAVRTLLKKHGLAARKNLGQNFLVDDTARQFILDAAELSPRDLVLEVGGGLGALTVGLAGRAGGVVTVEIDQALAQILVELTGGAPNVSVVRGDFLEMDIEAGLRDAARSLGIQAPAFKVVANLPYYLTGPGIARILESALPWERIILTVQKELAERMQAPPGTRDYGAFSVLVQYYARPRILRILAPGAFYPVPGVESAVVALTPRGDEPFPQDRGLFFRVIHAAFGQRRKTLRNALGGDRNLSLGREEAERCLQGAGIDPSRRAETLSMAEFVRLAGAVAARGGGFPDGC